MAKKTTVKPISLKYGDAGSGCEVKLMGVLKGLTIGQDEPDSTEIEAEFFDAPFDIFYDGNPVTFNFELANYDLSELPALFGGSYDAETDTYEGAANAFTSEHSWELEFQRGVASLYLYRGLTLGTIKKDEDGALNYAVTITALNWTDSEETEHMYKIVGTKKPKPVARFLRARKFGVDCYLVCKMTDGTERIVSVGGGFPYGYYNDSAIRAEFDFEPTPLQDGTTEQPDTSLLPHFVDIDSDNPSDLPALPAEFGFNNWLYFPPSDGQPAHATYSIGIFADGVDLLGMDVVASEDAAPMIVDIG